MSIEIIIPKQEYNVRELTISEQEIAMLADPKLYPQDMPCMICHFRWMQHKGKLCPARPGYFSYSLGRAVPPVLGNTEFIPDVSYFKEPDFDVE